MCQVTLSPLSLFLSFSLAHLHKLSLSLPLLLSCSELKSDLEVTRQLQAHTHTHTHTHTQQPSSLSLPASPKPATKKALQTGHVAEVGGALTRARAMAQLSDVIERFKVIEGKLMSGPALWRLTRQPERK